MEPRVERGDLGTGRGDAIAVGLRYSFDQAVQSESAEVIGHRPRGVRVGIAALQLREMIAELAMPKAGGREGEETERVHERVDEAVAEAQAGGPSIVDDHG